MGAYRINAEQIYQEINHLSVISPWAKENPPSYSRLADARTEMAPRGEGRVGGLVCPDAYPLEPATTDPLSTLWPSPLCFCLSSASHRCISSVWLHSVWSSTTCSILPMAASPALAKLRFRSTCDSCSISKVKCDKKQPICGRCRTSGFTCSYSPSRRHGKQSWARRVAEEQQQQQQQQYRQASPLPIPLATTSYHRPPSLLPLPTFSGANSTSEFSFIPFDPAYTTNQPELSRQMDVDLGNRLNVDYSALGGLDILGDGLDFLSHWTAIDPDVGLSNDPRASEANTSRTLSDSSLSRHSNDVASTPITSPGETLHNSEPQSTPFHDCEAKAFTVLHSLHFCTILHTDLPTALQQIRGKLGTVSSRMPPLDKVLFCNRVAMATLKELLECPCAQKLSHLALLYITIISKALYWYRLAASSQYQFKSDTSCPSGPPGSGHTGASRSCLTSVPSLATERAVESTAIQIGVFDLDEEDQKIMLHGVLMREVKKVDAIVERMRRLGTGHMYNPDGIQAPPPPTYYDVAVGKMRAEVLDTLTQIKKLAADINDTSATVSVGSPVPTVDEDI
jgi:hypothetical protein